jgi:hypothetical protein
VGNSKAEAALIETAVPEQFLRSSYRRLLDEARRTMESMQLDGYQPLVAQYGTDHTFLIELSPVLDDQSVQYFSSVVARAISVARGGDQGIIVAERSQGHAKICISVTFSAGVSNERVMQFCARLRDEVVKIVEYGVMALNVFGC